MWRRMMDGIEPEIVDSIEQSATSVPGVQTVGAVRARWVGHRVYSEIEIQVTEDTSVVEAARIKKRLSAEVKRVVPKLGRLVVEAVPHE